ncbi:MAG: ATP-binding protein [Deltaproteobacteria bacterium]
MTLEPLRALLAFGDEAVGRSVENALRGTTVSVVRTVQEPAQLGEALSGPSFDVLISDLWSRQGMAPVVSALTRGMPTVRVTDRHERSAGLVVASHRLSGASLCAAAHLALASKSENGVAAPPWLAELCGALPDAVLLLERSGAVVAASARGRALLGELGLLDDRTGLWLCDDERGPVTFEAHPATRALWFGEAREGRLAFHTPSGSVRELDVAAQPLEITLPGQARSSAAWVRLREPSLIHVENQRLELVGRMAASVAHDLNNVATAIMVFADFARSADDVEAARADLEEVLKAGRRAAKLSRKLLSLSRTDAAPSGIELGEHLAELVPMIKGLLPRDVELRTSVESGAWYVALDTIELDQILLNLVLNARDAVGATGVVEVTVGGSSAEVRLRVADDGEGVDPAHLDRIFEPNFSTKPREEGSGIGLATCKEIATRAGGTITARSERGAGAVFEVLLPRQSTPSLTHAPNPSPMPPPRGTGELCLVLESAPEIASAIQRALLEGGYRADTLPSRTDLVRWLRNHRGEVRIVFVDTLSFDADPTIALVSRFAPRAGVVWMGGSEPHRDLEAVRLTKPFTRSTLLDAAHAARQRGRRRAAARVLISTNNAALRSYLSRLTSRAGHDPAAVEEPSSAVDLLATTRFEAILIDLSEPEGIALVRGLRASERERGGSPTPIIGLSTSAQREWVEQLVAIGCDDILLLPIDPPALLGRIEDRVRRDKWVLAVGAEPGLFRTIQDACVGTEGRVVLADDAAGALLLLQDEFDVAVVRHTGSDEEAAMLADITAAGIPVFLIVPESDPRLTRSSGSSVDMRLPTEPAVAPVEAKRLPSILRAFLRAKTPPGPRESAAHRSSRALVQRGVTVEVPPEQVAAAEACLVAARAVTGEILENLEHGLLEHVESLSATIKVAAQMSGMSEIARVADELRRHCALSQQREAAVTARHLAAYLRMTHIRPDRATTEQP